MGYLNWNGDLKAFREILANSCNCLPATELKGGVTDGIKSTLYEKVFFFSFLPVIVETWPEFIFIAKAWGGGGDQCGSMLLSFVNPPWSPICGTICRRHMLLQHLSINHRPPPAVPCYEGPIVMSNLSKAPLMGLWWWWWWWWGAPCFLTVWPLGRRPAADERKESSPSQDCISSLRTR